MVGDEFLTRQPPSGELFANNFQGWEDWLKAVGCRGGRS
jgi:hypothetical protein